MSGLHKAQAEAEWLNEERSMPSVSTVRTDDGGDGPGKWNKL